MPIYKSFIAFIIATKRRAEALPAAQTDILQEHVTVKFRDEDAAVMAKALEGGSGSEKEEPL